jgi:uncharacterized protein (DUF1810 family)/GNAT superfamily N-acetyltransferase
MPAHDLQRFIDAQRGVFEQALSEIRAGRKRTHWMWFIFPQIAGLGSSPTSQHFAIRDRAEAKAYLEHPVLGPRLLQCVQALLELKGGSVSDVLGHPDDLKLKSSASLFAEVSERRSIFEQLLEKYFAGEPDPATLRLLGSIHAVRQAMPGDEPILRALRLEALSDAPEAFGSTYDRELARTTLDWRRWMSPGATFILDTREGPKGLAAGQRDAADPTVVQLMAMWVDPAFRRSGAADRLVAAVIAWAASAGATMVRLDVSEDNVPARRFYTRLGFRETGHATPHERDGRIELEMGRSL